jgi:hypothetical protein
MFLSSFEGSVMEVFNLGPDETDWENYRTYAPDAPEFLAVFYYYETAPYEGNGEALILTSVGWFRHNLGHCSCNEPLDNLDKYLPPNVEPCKTLDELLGNASDELERDLDKVVAKAREWLKKKEDEKKVEPRRDRFDSVLGGL